MYAKLRQSIQTGDLFLTASNALFSKLIRLFTRSEVSHIGVFMWLGERLFIVESIEGAGVVITLASERIKREKECWHGKPFGDAVTNTEKQMEEIMLGSLGKEYDMLGAVLSLIWDTKSSQVFCSEFAAKVIGYKPQATKRGITPSDLAGICKMSTLRTAKK